MPKVETPVDDEVVMPLRIVCTLEVDDPLLMEAMDLDLQRVAADYTTRISAVVEGLTDG